MPAWVSTATHPPPQMQTLMVRSSGSIYFAGFSKYRGWTLSGPYNETIEPPTHWWKEDAAKELSINPITTASMPAQARTGQMLLKFDDSSLLSKEKAA